MSHNTAVTHLFEDVFLLERFRFALHIEIAITTYRTDDVSTTNRNCAEVIRVIIFQNNDPAPTTCSETKSRVSNKQFIATRTILNRRRLLEIARNL